MKPKEIDRLRIEIDDAVRDVSTFPEPPSTVETTRLTNLLCRCRNVLIDYRAVTMTLKAIVGLVKRADAKESK